MKTKHLALLIMIFISIRGILIGQKDFGLSIGAEIDYHKNFGAIDTYDSVIDGYSPNSQRKAISAMFSYKNIGLKLSKFDLEFKGDGFENSFRTIELIYDDFPRDWSGKGGTYHSKGYLFNGFSVGIFKIFKMKHIDFEISVDYGFYDVKINGHHPSNRLFSYSYNTKEDFTSRHWAIYNGGSYFNGGVNLVKKIWKGINVYAGTNYRFGSFEYIFRETIRDDLVEENNFESELNKRMNFNSIGWNFGLKYVYEL